MWGRSGYAGRMGVAGRRRLLLCIAVCLGALLPCSSASAGTGDLDPSFSGDGRTLVRGAAGAEAVTVGADGSIYASSSLETNHGANLEVTKLTEDGSVDASWGNAGHAEIDLGVPSQLIVQVLDEFAAPDGSTTYAVATSGVPGPSPGAVVRLLPDGRLDQAFAAGSGVANPTDVTDAAFTPEGGVVYTGSGVIGKLTPDGVPDSSFGAGGTVAREGSAIDSGPNGSVFTTVGLDDGTSVLHLESDGSPDPAYGPGGISPVRVNATTLDLQAAEEGSAYLLAQVFTSVETVSAGLIRLTPAGTLDSNFGGRLSSLPVGAPASAFARSVLLDPGLGPLLPTLGSAVDAVSPNGGTNLAFGFKGTSEVHYGLRKVLLGDAALAPDGSIVLAGELNIGPDSNIPVLAVARLRASGGSDDVDLDALKDRRDPCPFAAGNRRSGCPVDHRRVFLKATGAGVKGAVTAKTRACRNAKGLKLVRVTPGGRTVLRRDIDVRPGGFSVASLRPGRYYASVRRFDRHGDFVCSAGHSRIVSTR